MYIFINWCMDISYQGFLFFYFEEAPRGFNNLVDRTWENWIYCRRGKQLKLGLKTVSTTFKKRLAKNRSINQLSFLKKNLTTCEVSPPSDNFNQHLHPRSLTARPWKMMVGRWSGFLFGGRKVTFQGRFFVKLQVGNSTTHLKHIEQMGSFPQFSGWKEHIFEKPPTRLGWSSFQFSR